jgi:pSer/pThr/pTyr-binding forkhead associated (FHA) protein
MVGLSFALAGDSLRVGRDPAAEVALRDQTVSRSHARLDRSGGGWTVTDLGSTNGTAVGGTRLAPNTPAPLRPGAPVQFGDVVCVVEGI